MKSFGNAVVKARHLILILAFVLLVPAVWGYTHTCGVTRIRGSITIF